MLTTSSLRSQSLAPLIDQQLGEEYNTIRYVANNLPALLLLVQKLGGTLNLSAILDAKLDLTMLGVANGAAPLGVTGKIAATFLPGGSVADHVLAPDPHTQYLTNTKGDARYAGIDANGKVNAAQLPSYVDDILEYDTPQLFPIPGERGKLYIAISTNGSYRWSGSTYVLVGDGSGNGSLGSTDALVEGAFNFYFTNARVRAVNLTGLDTTIVGTPLVTDTLIVALGKISNYMVNRNFDGRYALLAHTHVIGDITGLQVALDGKQPAGNYITAAAVTFANLQGKPTTLAGYGIIDAAPANHDHDALYQHRITSGTAAPVGGVDGDVYFKVA